VPLFAKKSQGKGHTNKSLADRLPPESLTPARPQTRYNQADDSQSWRLTCHLTHVTQRTDELNCVYGQ